MKKKLAKWLCIILAAVFFIPVGVYFGLAQYYKGGFSPGTWLNGVYCTGKSIEQVNEELLDGYTYKDLTIIDIEGKKELLSFQDMEMKADFTFSLNTLLNGQNPYLWIENLSGKNSLEVEPAVYLEEEKALRKIGELDCLRNVKPREERNVSIIKGPQGYRLVNEMENVIVPDRVRGKVLEAIRNGQRELNLVEAGCYENLSLTVQMLETRSLWEKIERFQKCGVKYRFGDILETVGPAVTAEWITLDEDGGFALDEDGNLILREEGIAEYIGRLALKYDTYGTVREFETTRGDTVTIEGGTYGNKIDQKAETAYLKEAYLKGRSETREPIYEQKALCQGRDDIGNTYIEIDMENQRMYYYIEGELALETPIVTGDMMRRRSTPAAVCFVYGKQRNRTLRGPGYASFVNYWMPVKGGIGIHDAPWRKNFGGDIYKKNGSHGCINTPSDKMKEIYERAEIGTPVVMYY